MHAERTHAGAELWLKEFFFFLFRGGPNKLIFFIKYI